MTVQLDLVQRAREERKSPAALKVRLSQLRSRFQELPILVLEGVDDVGPYEAWINRIADHRTLKMLTGAGKQQLLGLRTLLQRDETGLRARVFFAVDRDFDDLLGQAPGPDIFCTDRYSVENYVIDEHVVASVLRDEFRLEEGSADFDAAVQAYRNALTELTQALAPVNFRIYCCRRMAVRLLAVVPDVRRLAKINACRVEANITSQLLDDVLPIASELPREAIDELHNEFIKLEPRLRHRGKFFFQFLVAWTERLADEARNPTEAVLKSRLDIKFSSTSLTLRSLCSRTETPVGFRDFVTTMVAPT